MIELLLSITFSCVVTATIVRFASTSHGLHMVDGNLSGPQKFHDHPVPRTGGIGIFIGIVAGATALWWSKPDHGTTAALILLCSLCAFGAGLLEDLTKNVSPPRRLVFTAVSAALGIWLLDAVIDHTAIPGLDWIVSFSIGAVLVTIFAVAGAANAINIIDGFNGLASMCVVLMLAALGYVGAQVGDTLIVALSVIGIGAVMGFLVWNFPLGLIFLGDGGAYFLGFYVAEVAILLMHRNEEVSPLFPLLVCIYPVFETGFSIYRKKFLRKMSPSVPDGVHLHMLVYKRIMRWATGRKNNRSKRIRNSLTSPYLWILCMLAVIPAIVFWDNTLILALFILLFSVTYVMLYWRIVRFKTPRLMRASRRRTATDAPGQTARL